MSAPRRRAPAKRAPAKRAPARQRPAIGSDFWGTGKTLSEPAERIRPTDDAAAMIRSLGPPPLRGYEVAAAQYFEVVYERAVQLAVALASANGLLAVDDEEDEGGSM